MKLKLTSIALALALSSCTNKFESIKLVCEGEGEVIVKKAFDNELRNTIKEDRTYLITFEKYETINNNSPQRYDELSKKNTNGYVARFKSFFGDREIRDGSNYTFRGDEKEGKTETSVYSVEVSEDLIKIRQSNNFSPNNHSINLPESTNISINIEIDRVSGKFNETYTNKIDYGPMKGIYFDYRFIKGFCKKVTQNQI